MRQYDILSGILLILSIIGFALAAPVLVQEKRQACVDVVHIPRDAITVLGKRADDDFDEFASLVDGYINTWKKMSGTSDVHASSSSAPPGPNDGSTNVVQAPVPNPASSTDSTPDLNPLIKPSSPLPTASPVLSDSEGYEWLFEPEGDDASDRPLHTPTLSGDGLEHGLSSAPPGPDHGSTNVVQAPVPNRLAAASTPNLNPLIKPSSPSSTASPALSDSEDYEWLFEPEGDSEIHRPLQTPTLSGHGLEHELTSAPPAPDYGSENVVQAPAANPAANPGPEPLTDITYLIY